jgi:hypothetical protein
MLPLVAFAPVQAAPGDDSKLAATFYVAQTSTEEGWEDVFINPVGADYANDFLAVASVSRRLARYREGALQFEMEGQVAYHFGRQENWEFNAIPAMVRWREFPWSQVLATTAAFGLGLSHTTSMPELEVELEGESRRTLIYWVAELTAGLPERPWAVSLRLHHRSVGYGLMGDEGGMNAVGLGLRWQF